MKSDQNIEKVEMLKQKLNKAGIDTSTWGTGKTKTLKDLQKEIDEGETVLIPSPDGSIHRSVSIVVANIFYSSLDRKYVLIEDRQVLANGAIKRRRNMESLSEKIDKYDVDPKSALIRGVREELGIDSTLKIRYKGNDEDSRMPVSYPELFTIYRRYMFHVELTKDQFEPEGYVEEDIRNGQLVKTTYFVWQEIL